MSRFDLGSGRATVDWHPKRKAAGRKIGPLQRQVNSLVSSACQSARGNRVQDIELTQTPQHGKPLSST